MSDGLRLLGSAPGNPSITIKTLLLLLIDPAPRTLIVKAPPGSEFD